MQFIQSFSSLGYSGIVLLLTALFVWALIYNMFKLQDRGWIPKIILFVVMAVGVYFSSIYLADARKELMDAVRDDGGLKRTEKR